MMGEILANRVHELEKENKRLRARLREARAGRASWKAKAQERRKKQWWLYTDLVRARKERDLWKQRALTKTRRKPMRRRRTDFHNVRITDKDLERILRMRPREEVPS